MNKDQTKEVLGKMKEIKLLLDAIDFGCHKRIKFAQVFDGTCIEILYDKDPTVVPNE